MNLCDFFEPFYSERSYSEQEVYKSETSHSYATENERKWSDATRVTGSNAFLRNSQPELNKPDHFQSLKRINSLLKMFETTDTTQSKVILVAGST